MLDAGGYDVIAQTSQCEGNPSQRRAIGLGASTREHDLAYPGTEDVGHGFAGLVNGFPRILRQGVDAGGVAEAAAEIGQHRLQYLLAHRSGGRVVHVDHLCVSGHELNLLSKPNETSFVSRALGYILARDKAHQPQNPLLGIAGLSCPGK